MIACGAQTSPNPPQKVYKSEFFIILVYFCSVLGLKGKEWGKKTEKNQKNRHVAQFWRYFFDVFYEDEKKP